MSKQYYCKKTLTSIKIDGNLNKEAWQAAQGDFLLEAESGSEAKLKSEFKSLCNENYLYISFKCCIALGY